MATNHQRNPRLARPDEYGEDGHDIPAVEALTMAVKQNDKDRISALLDEGVDVNARNREGVTPLYAAAQGLGDAETMQRLIDGGADVNRRNRDGSSALHMAASTGLPDSEACTRLLIANGADVNAQNGEGTTPLHWATWNNIDSGARTLLDNGANPNVQDHQGCTPLHFAGHHAVNRLCDYGADPNLQDNQGNTPMHTRAQLGDAEAVDGLLHRGANVHVTNRAGQTAQDVAKGEAKTYLETERFDREKQDLRIAASQGQADEQPAARVRRRM